MAGTVLKMADHRTPATEGRLLEGTRAARMMAAAIDELGKPQNGGKSARQLSAELGYKSSVALSHMATGRAPIPIDRALAYAKKLKVDPAEFLLATLEQRFPDIDFMRILVGKKKDLATGTDAEELVADDLRSAAGCALSEIPEATLRLLTDLLNDRDPQRRVLSHDELAIMDIFRKERPDLVAETLSGEQRKKLREFVANL